MTTKYLTGLITSVVALTFPFLSFAQSAADQEVVRLSPFEVSSVASARYQTDEVASGGRIATNILSSPMSVTVLTNDFIGDIGGSRVFDVAKYVAGVSDATIPNAQDRANLRGFGLGARLVDGFPLSTQANYDHAAVEHIEIIKGPDSVLQPAGVPGGSINLVTKRPLWEFAGSLTAQVGEYDANRVEADVTGPINERFAYRVVAAAQDSKSYVKGSFRESTLLSPSLSWRIAPATSLTLRYEYFHAHTANLEGIPTDPLVGTDDAFRTMPGVSLDFNPAPGKDHSYRVGRSNTLSGLFTSVITDRLSVRLAARYSKSMDPDSYFVLGFPSLGGSINPATGKWEGGVLWTNTSSDPLNPNWVPGPAVLPDTNTVFSHEGTYSYRTAHLHDLQNDWSYIVSTDLVKSTSLIGVAYAYNSSTQLSGTQTLPNFTINTPQYGPVTQNPISGDALQKSRRYQAYFTQSLEFFDSRLVLSGGVSHIGFNGHSGNRLAPASPPYPAGMNSGSSQRETYNYGLVIKPIANLSVYYGHSENAVASADFEQIQKGGPPFSEGTQDEVGVKLRLFDGRVLASIAYYEIEQTGYRIYNPANITVPPPLVILPDILSDRKAKGWEYQVMGSITPQLSLIASYADTRNRDPYGIMLRGAPEDSAAGFVRYEFTEGSLNGLSVGLGANWSSKRSIQNISGATALTVPNQPSAYLPARTLMDAYVAYERSSWGYRVSVSNLTDKLYYASLARNWVMVANPRAFTASVTRKF